MARDQKNEQHGKKKETMASVEDESELVETDQKSSQLIPMLKKASRR